METQTLELVLWMLLAFFLGCILGYLLRKLFQPAESDGTVMPASRTRWTSAPVERAGTVAPQIRNRVPPPETPQATPAAKITEQSSEPRPATVPPRNGKLDDKRAPVRPQGLAGPRAGKADNLQQITGIGPKLEKTLHGLGFYHFDQIAAWSQEEAAWVDEHLRFKGRIVREQWRTQAQLLAASEIEKFTSLYGRGEKRKRTSNS